MTLNCLTLSKWVLSPVWPVYHKVVKNLFPLHICWTKENTVETWSFASSSVLQVFFPLFSKVFTNICKIYELPKYITKYLKYSEILVLSIIIIIYQVNVVPKVFFFVTSDAVLHVYNEPWIYGGDYYLSMRLFKFETLDKK